jgi:hypothetical protein
MSAIDHLALTGQPFTADRIQELVGLPADHPCRWGALLAGARKARKIECIGAVISPIDGRLLRLWRGIEQSSDGGA